MKNSKIQKNREEYSWYGKKYILSDEIVKGGCQGCAFYDRIDCEKIGRSEICTKKHKIFMRKLESVD